MSGSLFDRTGQRKYLVTSERQAFVSAALRRGKHSASFCATLALTGARISEVLALTSGQIDRGNEAIVFETLKQRTRGVFRAVPVPTHLVRLLDCAHDLSASTELLWPWSRTMAWNVVKGVMRTAAIPESFAMPKSLRHGFAVEAVQNGVPLNVVQRWLGHSRLETTAIYTCVIGQEERILASKTWSALNCVFPSAPTDRNASGI
jgi:integrase/recombinase XerD